MSTQKKNTRRKALAVGLAVLGVAGLSLASAATLSLNADNQDLIQAGTQDLTANLCQEDAIDVTFTLAGAAPGDLLEGADFGYAAGADALKLEGINAAGCADKDIKVALGDDAGARIGGEWASKVSASGVTIALTEFASSIDPAEIAKVSVTIY